MQYYIHYGLGFCGSLLTNEEADILYDSCFGCSNYEDIGVSLISFTEDYEGKDWSTVVLKDFGEVSNAGKMVTFADLNKLCSKEKIINLPTKEKILVELKKHNLEHLVDNVEVIIFGNNY